MSLRGPEKLRSKQSPLMDSISPQATYKCQLQAKAAVGCVNEVASYERPHPVFLPCCTHPRACLICHPITHDARRLNILVWMYATERLLLT